MFVTRDGEMDALDCGERPTVRAPWCRQRYLTVIDTEPSMTQQADLDQTDVNAIVARFERTGELPTSNKVPQYGDVTGLQGDFTELVMRSREHQQIAKEFADQWKPQEDKTETGSDPDPVTADPPPG